MYKQRSSEELGNRTEENPSENSNGLMGEVGGESRFLTQNQFQINFSVNEWNVAEGLPQPPPTDLLNTNPGVLDKAYSGLWAKLSRAFVTNIIFSLVIVLVTLITLSDGVEEKGEEAKRSMQRACNGLEVGATALASLPHYAADGLNRITIDGVNGIVTHTASMLTGAVNLLNQLILMVVERYTGLLFCLLDVIVQLAVGTVSMYAEEIVTFINTQLASIASALDASLGLLNGQLSNVQQELGEAVNTIAGVFGGTVNSVIFEPVTFPGVSRRLNFQIPTSFIDTLKNLANNVPTLSSLEKKLADLISEPFEMLEALIDNELGGLTGLASSDVVVPVPDASARILFCEESMSYEWVDVMVAAVQKALLLGIYLVIAAGAMTIIFNVIVIIYDHRSFEREVRSFSKILQGHQNLLDHLDDKEAPPNKKQSRAIARDLIHAASHPTLYRFTVWFTRFVSRSEKGSLRFRWFLDYVSHPPSLICFFAGLMGLTMVLLQIWMIGAIKAETAEAVSEGITASMDRLILTVETAMVDFAQPYVDSTNDRLNTIETTANDALFGWVDTTMDAINNTLFVFARGLDEALDDVFASVPPLQTAMTSFVACVLGSNMMTLEAVSQGLRSHAQINFPRLNTSALLGMDSTTIRKHLRNAEAMMTPSTSINMNVTASTDSSSPVNLLRRRDTSSSSTGSVHGTDSANGNATDSSADTGTTAGTSYFAREAEAFLEVYRSSLQKQMLPFGALMAFGSIVIVMGMIRVLAWVGADAIRSWRAHSAHSAAASRTTNKAVYGASYQPQRWYDRFKLSTPNRMMKQRPSGENLSGNRARPVQSDSESAIGGSAVVYRQNPKTRGPQQSMPQQPMISNVMRSSLLFSDTSKHPKIPEMINTPAVDDSYLGSSSDFAISSPKLQRSRTAPSGPRKMADFQPLVPRPRVVPTGPRAMLADASATQSAAAPFPSPLYPDVSISTTVTKPGLPAPMIPMQAPLPTRMLKQPSTPPAENSFHRQSSHHPYNTTSNESSDADEPADDWDEISREAAAAVAFLAAKAKRG
ncbi:hypothetical protein DFJ77DRAFT_548256 [Powellomyces hirtus]|nr:hypothetical protein DFJ77DRAFT_548256 [Powellomyces hirtus]